MARVFSRDPNWYWAHEKPWSKKSTPKKAGYSWDKWTNGLVWELVYGEDFWVSVESFRGAAYQWARHHNLILTSERVSTKVIRMQFRPADERLF